MHFNVPRQLSPLAEASSALLRVVSEPLDHLPNPTEHVTDLRMQAQLESVPRRWGNRAGKYLPLLTQGAMWNCRLSCMHGETGLRVTRAVIRDGDDRVQFERLAPLQGRFVGFRVGKDQLATPINGIDGNTVTFTDRDIAPYLETTLKPLPEIDHTEPWHIQLPKIAELTANPAVRAWHQADRRQIALEPSLFLTIDRHIVHIPSGRDTLGETAPLDSAGVSIVVKASRERRDENGERRQVNMTFVGNDYHVAEPQFEGRILALDPMSPTDYTGVTKFAPDPSPEARLELITSLTKVIRGDLGPTVR